MTTATTAIVLAIGNELVFGQTHESNNAFLSARLTERGIQPLSHLTVGDGQEEIAHAIEQAARRADIVIVSGGLGPTADDLTRDALADAMGVELVENEQCIAELEAFLSSRGYSLTTPNRVQSLMPVGAEPLANSAGTAPGMVATLGSATVFCMPGVPHEMRTMFESQVAPRLPSGSATFVQRHLHTFGLPESLLGEQLADLMTDPNGPRVGTTAKTGVISIRIIADDNDPQRAADAADRVVATVRERLGEAVFGEGDDTLAATVVRMLTQRGETLATAESCTGGQIGHMITAVSGASEVYVGGGVAYANRIKQELLSVPEALLVEHGAVSEPVAAAMAEGARERFGSDWAVSTTGVAGPTGGTEEKPVGLVYIAAAGAEGSVVRKINFPGTREVVRLRASLAALNLVRTMLLPFREA
jgi:nicotinamide-nucleotide amidase